MSESEQAAVRQRHGGHSRLAVTLAANRLGVVIVALCALVIGGVLILTTASWWLLAVLIVVVLLAMTAVVLVALQMTTETEHLAPTEVARLEDEGVVAPDAAYNDLVEEQAPDDAGDRGRETPAEEDPARAAAEQRSAVTPSSDRSKPVGPGGEDG